MTMPDRIARPGEIWLAYLHFVGMPNVGKVRPVLVVKADQGSMVVVVLKVTSRDCQDGRVAMFIPAWEECGLRKPSYLRLDQVFELSEAFLLNDAPVGKLDEAFFAEVLRRLGSSPVDSD